MIMQNKNILASILFVLISFVCLAQGEKLPPEPSDPVMASSMNDVTPAPGLPINGFVYGMLFLGLCFGTKKILSQKA
ncbi:hypothetical protein [Aestuariibaculum suncheonense]|uniref:Uncharacterized protein n=1 Tax=Aestuariibaculum suncheonense TaxID=1028745 RepID=A0A8J6UJ10_9FLAO|nr:hypothetical protein [Aestuariibaculum suncheonense]MBD0836759.1 hypothetical protein [Aestuariibaculum suncheonense]